MGQVLISFLNFYDLTHCLQKKWLFEQTDKGYLVWLSYYYKQSRHYKSSCSLIKVGKLLCIIDLKARNLKILY